MELNEILAVSGAPGLYKFVAQGKNGVIVESLMDGRRTMVSGTAKVSTLGDMAIFTDAKELPLDEVFQRICDEHAGKAVQVNGKSTPEELKKFMESAVPNYDRDKVHNSDIRKLAQWYNTLIGAGMTLFRAQEDKAPEKTATATVTNATASAGAKGVTAKATTTKGAAPKKAGAASGAKVPNKRSTTARKAQ